jgi:hypothetical protein
MASLKDLPPRPRSASTVPAYPRRVLLGAFALAAGVAACTPSDEPQVSGHLDDGHVETAGTGGSTPSSTATTAQGGSDPAGFGGQMAGAMPDPWGEGGGGDATTTTSTGQGGSCSTGFGGSFAGGAPEPWGGGGGGGVGGAGGDASTTSTGGGGGDFDGDQAEPWEDGGTGGS